ncbi:MAG: D-alanyl-D-alanine dipeptidase [Cyanobacteria bacterium CRU_2_1]|nr:D-alanyl-D-alanine dipeptidase [Cyanobacteria bacterium RU_5_0]NJR58883.1 D-alanyl-D-alanine dipeptidase [Cyanobacteria bacterium CRU_2_1]
MKPYQQVPIVECGEALIAIPLTQFAVEQPHPYVRVAAPYGDKSPYSLRQGVLDRLLKAQDLLQNEHPNWRIQIFDAYRPLAVQHYMVNYAFAQSLAAKNLNPDELTEIQRQEILEQVYQFWAIPSYDPTTPPPHSTGAAVDVTLVDARGNAVEMGSPIDEMSPRSYPNYFVDASEPVTQLFHQNRQLLKQVMVMAGFRQHPREWWHFSFGDQVWAWLINEDDPTAQQLARYGAIEFLHQN